MSTLPPPVDFGLPEQFQSWRKGQDDAVLHVLESPERFVGMVLPTGAGKSLVYMATAKLLAARAVNLTATKALQRQLFTEYGDDETVLVQGQSAYACRALQAGGELVRDYASLQSSGSQVMVDHGPCHLGVDCSLKLTGCEYFDAVRAAMRADVVITNYAWWFTIVNRPDIRMRPDLLVLDEAHAAPDQLAAALGADVGARDVGEILNQKLPKADGLGGQQWVDWARIESNKLVAMLEGTRPTTRDAARKLRRAQWLQHSLDRLAHIAPKLLLASDTEDGVRFDLVWAAPYAESHLFRGIKKIVLTSATLTTHTTDLLGIVPNDLTMYEGGDGFPRDRRPVYLIPTVRVDHKMSPESERLWLVRLDQILRDRGDRKGIVHTVSYRRRDVILSRSEYRERMITHGRYNTADQIRKFKNASRDSGLILVSPAVTTGYDFPYDECEYQIVCKIPFPDSRDPVVNARQQIDSKYAAHVAMQDLVQEVGRGMRAEDDRCETFIIDDHSKWFLSRHADLAPRWFRRAIIRTETVPAPPPRVERITRGAENGDN